MSYLGNNPNTAPSIVVSEHVATEGQTTFNASYYEYVQVYLNGMLLSASDYVANDGSTVVLAVGANAGDVVLINGYEVGLQGPAGKDGDVLAANNLSELTDKAAARTNLNVYSKTEVQTVLPKVGFDISNVTVPSAGQMAWNQDERTVDLGVNGVTLQLGQEQLINVRNNTGSVISNKTVVMATGTIGASGRITVAPYDGGAARFVLGVATEDIAVDADGFVTTFGKVREVDTSAWADGTVLYASTGGALTSTEPTSGVKLPMAIVINSHATAGTLFVRVTPIDENAWAAAAHGHTTLVGTTVTGLKETKVAMAANNIDLSLGNLFTKTISGATTFTVSNVPATGTTVSFILELTNGGSAAVTWWSNVKFAKGTAPTLTASGKDSLGIYSHDGGATWNLLVLGLDIK